MDEPTAQALLDDRVAMSPKPPRTGAMSWRARWPLVPPPGVAMGKVVQASVGTARGEAAAGEAPACKAVHAAVKAATAGIPARRRRSLLVFICPPGPEPCHLSVAARKPNCWPCADVFVRAVVQRAETPEPYLHRNMAETYRRP